MIPWIMAFFIDNSPSYQIRYLNKATPILRIVLPKISLTDLMLIMCGIMKNINEEW